MSVLYLCSKNMYYIYFCMWDSRLLFYLKDHKRSSEQSNVLPQKLSVQTLNSCFVDCCIVGNFLT